VEGFLGLLGHSGPGHGLRNGPKASAFAPVPAPLALRLLLPSWWRACSQRACWVIPALAMASAMALKASARSRGPLRLLLPSGGPGGRLPGPAGSFRPWPWLSQWPPRPMPAPVPLRLLLPSGGPGGRLPGPAGSFRPWPWLPRWPSRPLPAPMPLRLLLPFGGLAPKGPAGSFRPWPWLPRWPSRLMPAPVLFRLLLPCGGPGGRLPGPAGSFRSWPWPPLWPPRPMPAPRAFWIPSATFRACSNSPREAQPAATSPLCASSSIRPAASAAPSTAPSSPSQNAASSPCQSFNFSSFAPSQRLRAASRMRRAHSPSPSLSAAHASSRLQSVPSR
jgi:hypothetical protein